MADKRYSLGKFYHNVLRVSIKASEEQQPSPQQPSREGPKPSRVVPQPALAPQSSQLQPSQPQPPQPSVCVKPQLPQSQVAHFQSQESIQPQYDENGSSSCNASNNSSSSSHSGSNISDTQLGLEDYDVIDRPVDFIFIDDIIENNIISATNNNNNHLPRFATAKLLMESWCMIANRELDDSNLQQIDIAKQPIEIEGKGVHFVSEINERAYFIKCFSASKERDQFTRECNLLRACGGHPNIAAIYGHIAFNVYGSIPNFGIVMENFEMSLSDILRDARAQQSNLLWIDRIAIAYYIANGMSYIASKRIIHNDLKPGNVMIRKDGRVVIIDLGAGHKVAHSRSFTTNPGTYWTVMYQAPERRERDGSCPRSDVFSLGIMMYELYKLKVEAWTAEFIPSLNSASGPPVGCDSTERSLSRFKALQMRCVSLNWEDRPHFTEVRAELYNILRELL